MHGALCCPFHMASLDFPVPPADSGDFPLGCFLLRSFLPLSPLFPPLSPLFLPLSSLFPPLSLFSGLDTSPSTPPT